jgi:hypothetical protein
MIHIDANNKFRSVFEAVCKSLSLWLSVAAKGNHQSVSIMQFVKRVNNAVTIATQDWATLLYRSPPSSWHHMHRTIALFMAPTCLKPSQALVDHSDSLLILILPMGTSNQSFIKCQQLCNTCLAYPPKFYLSKIY